MTAACTRFTGKTALVTGACGGIGLAIAKRLASEGARLVLVDLDPGKFAAAGDAVRAAGAPDVLTYACDVSHEDQVAAGVAAATDRFGALHLVVNNAGLMQFKAIQDLDAQDWLKVLGVDLLGTAFFLKQALLTMKPGGAIVNIASIHALQTEALAAPYAAAKAAVLSLTRTASIEGKAKGLRCNAILPGAIDTPMLWDNPNVKSGVEKIDKADVGQPEDIAAAVAFLGSDDAAFITGASLNVDGGRMAKL
jgi:meso-butanediol dehydrogenase/(S,S)-butanediol dehydrogenase/diacetyl reductase